MIKRNYGVPQQINGKFNPEYGRRRYAANRKYHDQYSKAWVKNHPKEKAATSRKNRLKTQYNLTLEQYDKMFQNQKGVCACCGKPPSTKRRLAVDHCHVTGKIRKLLCISCNVRVGFIEGDNIYKQYLKIEDIT